MGKMLAFGHKNPDTDSICSSIVTADLQNRTGNNVEPVRIGNINKETKYALDYFKVEEPRYIDKVEEGQQVILVDHNEFNQSVDGIEKAKIEMVIDHHRICNFETTEPIYYFSQPVGCTATLLYILYKINNVEIEEKMAGLMLSAIISDTLLLKSPTCTKHDVQAAEELSKMLNIDMQKYGLDLLKAGTDLDDFSEEELINLDAKTLEKNGAKYVIAQVNTVSIEDVYKRQEKLEKAINEKIDKENLDLFILAVTDILNSNSDILVLGKRKDIIEKEHKLENNRVFLEGVVSRKKQLLPMVEKNI